MTSSNPFVTNLRIPECYLKTSSIDLFEKSFLNTNWILNIFGGSDPVNLDNPFVIMIFKKSNVLIVTCIIFYRSKFVYVFGDFLVADEIADERLIMFKIWEWIKFLERIVSNKIWIL